MQIRILLGPQPWLDYMKASKLEKEKLFLPVPYICIYARLESRDLAARTVGNNFTVSVYWGLNK